MPRPKDLPITTAEIAKARAFLQARGHPSLKAGLKTRGELLTEVLRMHRRTAEEIHGVDVGD